MATKLKRGDLVVVVAGKDKGQKKADGKQGRIISIDHKKGTVLVEGVNMVKKHQKSSQTNPQGGIIDKEAPIHISNVSYLYKGKPTRIGFKLEATTVDGKTKTVKKRVAKPSGDIID